ncbi:bifunctional 2-polyprenyl-6-hydroxyphenol methylase/3-demethylubiquinol 3-O-methyltransferase UbiG [Bartonella sp. DGB1]|uniref:bifunctional 2-polyprenyl-6-hydroxyphenol methylase/3-demethylubiquinol 3-O-methyltransferase UbiG n=1 Tax=Bartonella sp. DGB1 TaxID=3239807 RepID=UPI003524DB3A
MTGKKYTTIDEAEVKKFSDMADDWWNPNGKFKPLHKFNPIRLTYLKNKICEIFNRDPLQQKPLTNISILDIGCGGGLLAEPLVRLGATVTAIDASKNNIEVAKVHAKQMGLNIDYQHITAEELLQNKQKFDVVLAMEIVEHVSDVTLFTETIIKLVNEDGLLFMATINRTIKAWLLAIVAAEYILRWLPIGTHNYEKLVKPQELIEILAKTNMKLLEQRGFSYNPIKDIWKISQDLEVNYILLARKIK